MTTLEFVKKELLKGRKVNKFDLLNKTGSVCLAQRILDIRQEGWDVRSRAIKGKGNLREYYLDKDERQRIKDEKNTTVKES